MTLFEYIEQANRELARARKEKAAADKAKLKDNSKSAPKATLSAPIFKPILPKAEKPVEVKKDESKIIEEAEVKPAVKEDEAKEVVDKPVKKKTNKKNTKKTTKASE